jgi:hypothetical protein
LRFWLNRFGQIRSAVRLCRSIAPAVRLLDRAMLMFDASKDTGEQALPAPQA